MKQNRGAELGKCIASCVNYLINTLPDAQRENYKDRFIDELKKYSFTPKRKDEPPNAGCIYELEDIVNKFDPQDPKHLAKVCKEIAHCRYNKAAAASILNSILGNIQQNP